MKDYLCANIEKLMVVEKLESFDFLKWNHSAMARELECEHYRRKQICGSIERLNHAIDMHITKLQDQVKISFI